MHNNLSVENNFIGGLKTEFTGLNFPENACTATSDCVFTLFGNVVRRPGINYESHNTNNVITSTNLAISSFKWENAGGDGQSQIVVVQVGATLEFFVSSNATSVKGVSGTLITPTVSLNNYKIGSGNPSIVECQYAMGNGYLFVFNPVCDPFYVQYDPAHTTVVSGRITIQQRDFTGINPEPGNPAISQRPSTLNNEHNYNLQNQGWTNNATWSGSAVGGASGAPLIFSGTTATLPLASTSFTIQTGLTITNGTIANISWSCPAVYQAAGDGNYNISVTGTAQGNVTSYTSGTGVLVINVTQSTTFDLGTGANGWVSQGTSSFTITSSNLINTISTWNTQIGNFPSNADIWWTYIVPQTIAPASLTPIPGLFSPSNTVGTVPLSATPAPQGHFVLSAFNQDRTNVSGVPSLTVQSTSNRPRTGCWFQGRVWYAGVDGAFSASGDAPYYTWTENIYFSQIVTVPGDFGLCYQQNDPTDNRLFNLLPTDGGVIYIQGSGAIYKLFPIQNGILVFAANGIWLIRGNTGLGFVADDYTVSKISAIQCKSGTSFVDVQGLPYFWNDEAIYAVVPTQGNAPYGFGGFQVEPLTVGTIKSFYQNISTPSILYARGTYDPINYVIKWVYRTTAESGIGNRYNFNGVLNYNLITKAWYPYVQDTASNAGSKNAICGIIYVNFPSANISPEVKYLNRNGTVAGTWINFTMGEENDTTHFTDWFIYDSVGAPITSTFTTGYRLHGQAFKKFMPVYVHFYTNGNLIQQFTLRGIWGYALGPNNSGARISGPYTIDNRGALANFFSLESGMGLGRIVAGDYGVLINRLRLPGHDKILQLKITSIAGQPFDIHGWTIPEYVNVSA